MSQLSIQKNYIHGRYQDSSSHSDSHRGGEHETLTNYSPSTGEKICDVQIASPQDIEKGVESAERGFQVWSAFTGAQRARILIKAAQIIRERADSLAHLEVLDTGKPISEALSADIPTAVEAIEFFAGIAPTLHGQHIDLGTSFAYTRKEPLGVCAGIGAWNYPFQIACWKAAPALAAGNSMIFKPSELTPLTALKLAEIFTEAGVPEGVFNVLQGPGKVGRALSEHPRIRKISLTGSVPTGKNVMSAAAGNLKHVTLELGGKSPLILFADAMEGDRLDQAVSGALLANFYTQGEVCCNGTRVFVEESVLEHFLTALVPKTKKIKLGDPFEASTQMGALISRPHLEKVSRYIENAKKEGAQLVCGGETPPWDEKNAKLRGGNFISPTIFLDCKDQMTHVREEIFGPVMSILTFKSEDEVIARANQTDYGLAAGVFTQDIKRAHRVVSKLQAGMCWINNYNVSPIEVPFGGYKQSGIGRENGIAAIDYYTQLKTVYVEMGKGPQFP